MRPARRPPPPLSWAAADVCQGQLEMEAGVAIGGAGGPPPDGGGGRVAEDAGALAGAAALPHLAGRGELRLVLDRRLRHAASEEDEKRNESGLLYTSPSPRD